MFSFVLKREPPMKPKNLSLKTVINKLDFLGKTVIIQWNTRKQKRYKLIEKKHDPRNAK